MVGGWWLVVRRRRVEHGRGLVVGGASFVVQTCGWWFLRGNVAEGHGNGVHENAQFRDVSRFTLKRVPHRIPHHATLARKRLLGAALQRAQNFARVGDAFLAGDNIHLVTW